MMLLTSFKLDQNIWRCRTLPRAQFLDTCQQQFKMGWVQPITCRPVISRVPWLCFTRRWHANLNCKKTKKIGFQIECPVTKGFMPKGLYLRWLEEPGGTPQVLGSTPRGSEFQAEVKKIPSLALCAKALVVIRPQVGLKTLTWPRQVVPRGYVSQCQGGARVRGFSRSEKPRLLLKLIPVGRSFPTRPSFFLT